MKLNWQRLSAREVILLAVMGISICISLNLAVACLGLARLFPAYSEVSHIIYDPPFWQQVLMVGLVMPAAEELAFRGLVFSALRKSGSFLMAALLSAACFGLYHGNVLQGIYGFVVGFLLAWVLEESGRILAPMAVHMAANLTSITASAVGFSGEALLGPMAAVAAFLAACVCAGTVWMYHKRECREQSKEKREVRI